MRLNVARGPCCLKVIRNVLMYFEAAVYVASKINHAGKQNYIDVITMYDLFV